MKRRQNDRWQRLCASATILALAAGIGCTSSKPARVVEAAPASREAPNTAQGAAVAEIRTLDLREGAPEVFVDLESSAPLVWTSFRNADGKVVVELPNSAAREGLADLSPEDGLVSALQVQRNPEGSRPMTRLVIATRQEVEHSISADGNRLQIRLLPVEQQAESGSDPGTPAEPSKLAFEPLGPDSPRGEEPAAAPEPVEPEPVRVAASAPSGPVDLGTPDRPAVAPAPSGVTATRLEGIEVLASEGGAVIRIGGDGEFPYSTFALDAPDRFIIDLEGVVNRSPRPTLSVEGGIVERVRVAQFKPLPKPVSRVVFDLSRDVVPVIERTSDALVVSFPSASGNAAVKVSPAARVAAARTEEMPEEEQEPEPEPVREARRPSAQVSDLALAQGGTPSPRREPDIEVEEANAAPPPTAPPPPVAPEDSMVQMRPATRRPAAATEVPATGGSTGAAIESFETQTIGTERVYTGEPIDLKVTNADVTEVIRTFAQISGLNVLVQPGVQGAVTAELENVPWDQALEQILKINGLGYEVEGNVMRIAPVSVLRQEAQEEQQLAAAKAL
ncbi:MAG TPA: AMIN domain-containing protein, partial [Thermoanaerobaculia bacterium]